MENQEVSQSGKGDVLVLSELEREFFNDLKKSGKSINTLKNYRTDIECFNRYLSERQDSLDIGDFNFQKVQEYGDYISTRYNSDNSRRRRVQALRIFFDFLVDRKIYQENPVRKLSVRPKFLDIPRPTSLPDIQKLWNYLIRRGKKDSLMEQLIGVRNQVVFVLIYSSALKVSDFSQLKMDHIDSTSGAPRVMVIPRKRDPYSIPIDPIFNEIFDRYQRLLPEGKAFGRLDFPELLFNANPFRVLRGGLSPRGLELIFEGFRHALEIEVTPKSLRQAAIFNWLGKNHTDALIKEWLGVAPSYSLKLYRSYINKYPYNSDFFSHSV